MVKDLDTKTFKKLRLLRSPFNLIEEVRERGRLLCIKLKKDPLLPEQEDIDWFWQDMDLEIDKEVARAEILEHKELLDWYNFDQVVWIDDFYWLMVDALKLGWDNAGLLDWIVFFSLTSPRPPLKMTSFSVFMEALLPLKKEQYREYEINYILEHDPETLIKILKGDIIPYYYTSHITYHQLQTRIVQKLSKSSIDFKILSPV